MVMVHGQQYEAQGYSHYRLQDEDAKVGDD
jgi:hypothetical protein